MPEDNIHLRRIAADDQPRLWNRDSQPRKLARLTNEKAKSGAHCF
jgi:hypothetical protein